MIKKIMLCLLIIGMLTACSSQTGQKDLMNIAQQIEQEIKAENIASLRIHANKIKAMYKKHDWKIHLLGDEGEYERLNETINRLIAAIDAEELSEAQIELATLKTILKDIYSL